MSFTEQFRLLSQYNSWMNEKIYHACNQLSEQQRKQNCEAFFGSIHGTLDHIIYADTAWLERLRDNQFTPRDITKGMFDSWQELTKQRFVLDKEILNWTHQLDGKTLNSTFTYKSNVDKKTRSAPYWCSALHMFNHQTHHRGQLTTLLTQRSIDIGDTDIAAMPAFISEQK